MQRIFLVLAVLMSFVFMLSPTSVEARECWGCRCKVECWSNGVCRDVCRDSCGQFCFAEPEAVNFTPFEPMDNSRPGVGPTGKSCPTSHPIKGNFTTYDGSRCIAHRPGGGSYAKTIPERCYSTIEEAKADGCRAAKR